MAEANGSVGPATVSLPPPKKCITSNPSLERSCCCREAPFHKELNTVVLRQGSMLHAAHTIHISDSCLQLPKLPCSAMCCGETPVPDAFICNRFTNNIASPI